MNAGGRWNEDFDDQLIRPQIVFTVVLGLRNHIELFKSDLTQLTGAEDAHLRSMRNQRRNYGRRADEICRSVVAENCVVAVVARKHQRLPFFAQERKSVV